MVKPMIQIKGDKEYRAALRKFPRTLKPAMEMAGREGAAEILDTEGVQKYPPHTEANQPPEPYYIRGRGMQRSPGYNDMRSEQYGTKFTVKAEGYKTTIGNTASYAGQLGGEDQARHMGALGWRRMVDAGREKAAKLKKIYVGWVDRALRQAGLK